MARKPVCFRSVGSSLQVWDSTRVTWTEIGQLNSTGIAAIVAAGLSEMTTERIIESAETILKIKGF